VSVGIRKGVRNSWRCGTAAGFVGIACTWPLARVFGRCLASLRVVGHSRRSRWSAWVRTSVLRFPVPQRYGDCRCVSRPAAAAGWQVSACCVTHSGAEQRIRRLLTLPGQLSLQHAARQLGTRHAILASQVRHTGPSRTRISRSAAFPHPPSTPPHDGQHSCPAASCRSTTSRSPFTVSTTPPRVNPAALPSPWPNEETGGPHPCRRDHRAVAHQNGQPLKAAQNTSATSVTQTRAYIVILSDRAHPCGPCSFPVSPQPRAAVRCRRPGGGRT